MKVTTELKDFQKETIHKMIQYESIYDGGLLLNEAGLGKSICVLGLILNDISVLKTLVICPAGLVDNWINEIKKHTDIKDNQIMRFYGPKRHSIKIKPKKNNTKNKTKNIEEKQIWITSYTTLSNEVSFLVKQKFKRIVLDEAHYIRNCRTAISKRIFELSESNLLAKKWVVTATPIYNDSKDAYSYFKFMNHVTNKREWNSNTGTTIKAVKVVNDLIKKYGICYRKSEVLTELIPKKEIDIDLSFSPDEQEFYDALKEYSLIRLKRLINRVKDKKHDITLRRIFQMNVLTHILRLKQACNSPKLVINKISRLDGVTNIKNASEMLKYYNESINIEQECPICLDQKANCIVDPCGHKYCGLCWDKLKKHNIAECPICRQEIHSMEMINQTSTMRKSDKSTTKLDNLVSIKIKTLCDLVTQIIEKGEKVVIVSQWVQMLNLIKDNSLFNNVKYVTLQGNRSIEERMDSINLFQTNDDIKVCFLSMTSSAEGINLVAANHLILVDSWWNQSQMIQVMNRIHRIGQNKDVNIYKLRITNTIEEKIKNLVNKKFNITKNILEKYDEDKLVQILQNDTKLLQKE